MTIADRIQNLRKTRGISQEELADRIGVSRQAVSKWESKQSTPDVEKIISHMAWNCECRTYHCRGDVFGFGSYGPYDRYHSDIRSTKSFSEMQILETKYLDDIVFAVVGHLEYRDSTDARTISSGV